MSNERSRHPIAIRVDPDVLDPFRKEARRRRVGYQTLMRSFCRWTTTSPAVCPRPRNRTWISRPPRYKRQLRSQGHVRRRGPRVRTRRYEQGRSMFTTRLDTGCRRRLPGPLRGTRPTYVWQSVGRVSRSRPAGRKYRRGDAAGQKRPGAGGLDRSPQSRVTSRRAAGGVSTSA